MSAVDSLSGDNGQPEPRDVKYGVLHLQAAVETLLKARLEIHDPRLVWTKTAAFDEGKHKAGDFSSCRVEVALERLRDTVRIVSDIDPKEDSLTELAKLRNRIMHFGWKDTVVAVQARTIPVLDLLVGFVNADVLPYVSEASESWSAEQHMEQVRAGFKYLTDFIAHRMQALGDELAGYERTTAACRSCGQFAVVLDGGAHDLACLLCGKQYGTGSDAAWELIGSSQHITLKDGGSDLNCCGSCGDYAVISTPLATAPETGSWICFACGSTFEGVCAFCGQASDDIVEAYEDMCSDCFQICFDKF
ncbi:hypothetical protein ACW69C_30515 [Streptomyces sp. MN3]